MPTSLPSQPQSFLAHNKLTWLLSVQALILLPLLVQLPIWLWLLWAGSVLWRIQMYRGRWSEPQQLIKIFLVLGCAAGLYASYAGKTNTEAMAGLLACAFILKLLEVKTTQNAQLLIFIGFIMAATQLLFRQSPLAALYTFMCLLGLITCWRSLELQRNESALRQLQRSSQILLHSLPLMLLLFVVLPRLGPLWAIPTQDTAQTGFSDSIAPGDLGKLALSKAPAFRVSFKGAPPSNSELYWRGLVLTQFDGRRWYLQQENLLQQVPTTPSNLDLAQARLAAPITYDIIIEPHGQQWLFSLMQPLSATANNSNLWINRDDLILSRFPVVQRLNYKVSSSLNVSWNEAPQLDAKEQSQNLQLPANLNPQTRALINNWRTQGLSPTQISAAALTLFNQSFSYTLQPPKLGIHSVDDFLFNSKRGFCEHFASSFTFMMRAAGIPARVVVGYQGGQWNELDNYLLVRQADAHAWSEIWLEGKGWQRLDPTAAVAPERIEQGFDDALNEEDQALSNQGWQNSKLLSAIQKRWDAANYNWQRWVLSYDQNTQEGLFTRLLGGTEPWRLLSWLLGIGITAAIIITWALMRTHKTPPASPETEALKPLLKRLQQAGYTRDKGETLAHFLYRVCQDKPQWAPSLTTIRQLYEQVAYQHRLVQLSLLKEAVIRFPSSVTRSTSALNN